jgi:hypothetical protein
MRSRMSYIFNVFINIYPYILQPQKQRFMFNFCSPKDGNRPRIKTFASDCHSAAVGMHVPTNDIQRQLSSS